MAGLQAAGSTGAFASDLSGINQFFQRQADAARQREAIRAQQQQAQNENQWRMAIAQMQDATARRGQDFSNSQALAQLGLGRDRLGLDRELGTGQLGLGQQRLAQDQSQFTTSQANDMERFFANLGQNQSQFDATQDYRNRALAQEGSIQNRRLGIEELSAQTLNALRGAQTEDIAARRVIDELLARANVRNIDSTIEDRAGRLGLARDQFGYGQQKDQSDALGSLARLISPEDSQRASLINEALTRLGSTQIAPNTRFADSPDPAKADQEKMQRVLAFFSAIQSTPDPAAREALGEALGIEKSIIDRLKGVALTPEAAQEAKTEAEKKAQEESALELTPAGKATAGYALSVINPAAGITYGANETGITQAVLDALRGIFIKDKSSGN